MFVGAGRVRVVRELAEAWDAAVRHRRVGVVVIEGPSGSGKTAVVQALYGQLAMLQSRPAYWPAMLGAPGPPGARMPGPAGAGPDGSSAAWRREQAQRMYPVAMAPAPGSRPGFFWWGITARMGAFAVLDGDPQIKRHVQGIAEALARAIRMTRDRLSLALKTGSFLAGLGLLGPALGALAADAGNVLAVRDLLRAVPAAAQSRASLLEGALRRNSGTVFSVGLGPQAVAAAEDDGRCLGLVASVLPMLVAVKDAQLLDPVTIRLLDTLSRQSGAAGLIVLTVSIDQPGALAGDAQGDWLDAEDRARRLTRVRLGPLSAEELTEIAVAELGTGLDAGMLARVVRHADGVPGILYDLLEAPAVAQALREGGEGPPDLAAIPALAGVQAALAAAQPPVRRALAVIAVHGRMTIRDWLYSPGPAPGDPGPAPAPGLLTTAPVEEAIAAGWLQHRPGTPADALPPALAAELLTLRRVTGRDAATTAFLAALTERLTSGRPHPRVLTVATAEALFDQGQADKAFQLLHDDYTNLQAEYGEDHPRTRPALHNLAAAYAASAQALRGQPQSAPLYQTAIALYNKLLTHLLECGLLAGSFIPPAQVKAARDVVRYRTKIAQQRVSEIARLGNTLQDAGIKIDSVASSIATKSGRAMIEALIDGERRGPSWPSWPRARCAPRSRTCPWPWKAASVTTTP